MKKIFCILILAVVALSGCGRNVNSSASGAEPPSETVKTLFEEAANTIKDFVTEDPRDALDEDFNDTDIKKTVDANQKLLTDARIFKLF